MARAPKLKVFRMPVGFHDAYVAAFSQKAAAGAWGADASVFSRGEAELVTDPALTAEPLASPGKVIKRLRGTAEEQLAALPAETPTREPTRTSAVTPRPRPSRVALDEAEAALAAAAERHGKERGALAEREKKLAEERRALESAYSEQQQALEDVRDQAEQAYEQALDRWRAAG